MGQYFFISKKQVVFLFSTNCCDDIWVLFEKNMTVIGKIDMHHFHFENCAKKCQKEKFKNLRQEKVTKNRQRWCIK